MAFDDFPILVFSRYLDEVSRFLSFPDRHFPAF